VLSSGQVVNVYHRSILSQELSVESGSTRIFKHRFDYLLMSQLQTTTPLLIKLPASAENVLDSCVAHLRDHTIAAHSRARKNPPQL
jgi:hypothetical protein